MLGTRDLSYDRKKSPSPGPGQVGSRSPEKRVRSASPTPGPATSTDIKLDKGEIYCYAILLCSTFIVKTLKTAEFLLLFL